MPEGDTLFKIAARLRPALQGHRVTRFEAPRLVGDAPELGERIEQVEARGKHLLVHFERGLVLRTHLRMSGSWHVYRERERWQKPAHLARAVIGTDSGWVAVCFQAPVVETYHQRGGDPAPLASLGPDLCQAASLADDVLDDVVARSRRLTSADATLGEALLDQRIAAGIGNVYKSEACFAAGLDPGMPLIDLPDDARRRVWQVAARQLQANLVGSARRTHAGGLAVYGRRGQPCRRCGTPIRVARQGEQQRSSYWCPTCQPAPATRESFHKSR
ncbi:MAG: Fpg/Nei family DNA glycosylase [Acidimicrobiales bacterium]